MLWFFLLLAIYPYVVYPLIIRALAASRHRSVAAATIEPSVTVVIAAHNEATAIEETARNKLCQDYPRDRLSVIVVSDASDDGTDGIVEQVTRDDSRVRLIRQEARRGKTAALNLAIAGITSDIIVFSDANSRYAPDAISQLVKPFSDQRIGYVTGRMIYTDRDGAAADDGGGAYMRYENRLRVWESAIGSIVGVDGGIDAVRRELYVPMQPDQLPDLVLPLMVVQQGYRVVYRPDAVLEETSLSRDGDEFRMRVRVALRALWAIWDKRNLLNPLRFPLYSWQLASHKLLRYLSVYPLLCALAVAIAGFRDETSHLIVAGLFAAACVAALLGAFEPFRNVKLLRLLHFFTVLNLANLVASFRFLKRDKIVVWRPRLG